MTRRRLAVLLCGLAGLGWLSYARLRGPQDETPRESHGSREGSGSKASPSAAPVEPTLFDGSIFGTTYHVKAYLPLQVEGARAQAAVDEALSRVDAAMSTYKPESELSRFNRTGAGVWFSASGPLMEVLELSRAVSTVTSGAFDPTVGPLVRAWGFGARAESAPPSDGDVQALLGRVGMQHVELDVPGQRLRKDTEGVELDLSAVAKGYGVDRAATALDGLGSRSYMVEVGGEIRVRGRKSDDEPWKLGIELPSPEERALYGTLSLSDAGLATSGDYRNFRATPDGFVSHTLDPKIGKPVPRRTASVSVVRPTAAEADALATALSVLPPGEGLALADEQGWAVLLLLHGPSGTLRSRSSRAWEALDFEPAPAFKAP